MFPRKNFNKEGFTLVELLVVVAIIGLLATFVLASVQSVRSKARDAKRRLDLGAMKTALDLYFSTYGYYPPRTTGDPNNCDTSLGNSSTIYGNGACFRPCGQRCIFGNTWSLGDSSSSHSSLYYSLVTQTQLMPSLPLDPLNGQIIASNRVRMYYYAIFWPGDTLPTGAGGGTCTGPSGKGCFYELVTNLETSSASWCADNPYYNYCVYPSR